MKPTEETPLHAHLWHTKDLRTSPTKGDERAVGYSSFGRQFRTGSSRSSTRVGGKGQEDPQTGEGGNKAPPPRFGMKGQASLDSLLMMGLGLILAAAFFFVVNIMLSDSIASAQAEDAVQSIAQEVKYVYSSGEGTVRYADVTIPNGVEEINLDGNRVHMRVSLSSGSTDFYSNTPVKLVGSIPAEPGYERVTVRYLPSGDIQVGDLTLTASPKSVYFYLERSGTGSSKVLVTNNANFTITGISATLEGLSDMASISEPASTLAQGAGDNITISVSVPSNKPVGTYTGYIRINSSNDGWDDVFVSVSVQGGNPASCTLSPSSANLSLGQSQLFTSSCRNNASEPVPCPLLAWSSDAGNAIPAVSYSTSTLVATSSGGTYMKAQAPFSCNASVSVTSTTGPLVTSLSVYPASPRTTDNITVNATGDDTGRGDLAISMCMVKVDSGSWINMNASDGSYNSIIENATRNIGALLAGSHTAYVQCNDSDGNIGPQNSLSFNVASVDTTGPIVTALFTTPSSPSAGQSITINATGNDSTTGGSNISLCQLSVDGAAWQAMNANDGAYNNVAESVSLSIGTKSVGRHNATVRCNDSAGNMGNSSSINFTVSPKSILFITNGASASTNEQYWLTWISGHSSGLGLNWSYDTAQDSAVVAGTTNATNYKIVIMAEYDNALSSLNTTLKNFQNSGGYILMVSSALQYGPRNMSYTASDGTSDNTKNIYIVTSSHYITSGYATGSLSVISPTSTFWRNTNNLGGTILADGMKANSRQTGEPTLDSANRLVTWGATEPANFNTDGDTITTRALDYCLNASTIGS